MSVTDDTWSWSCVDNNYNHCHPAHVPSIKPHSTELFNISISSFYFCFVLCFHKFINKKQRLQLAAFSDAQCCIILSIRMLRSLIVTVCWPRLRTPRLTKWWTRDLILHNCCGKFLVNAKTGRGRSRGLFLYCHWAGRVGGKTMIFFEFVQQNTREWGGTTQIYHLAGEFYITTLVMFPDTPGWGHQSKWSCFGEERREMKSLSGDKNGIAMFRLFITRARV